MSGLAHPFQPAKLLWHRDAIEKMHRGEMTPGPISLEWDLSNVCPHDCPFCSFGTSDSGGYRQQNWQHFPFARALALVPELVAAGVKSVTFTGGGEPLIHPKAAEIIGAVAATDELAFGLVTNGCLLRGDVARVVAEGARFVRVSLDAGTTLTHDALHRPKPRGQFDQILRQMAHVRDLASSSSNEALTMGASFCVTDRNWHEIGLAAAKAREAGADYLEVRPTYPTDWRGDGWQMALTDENTARARVEIRSAKHEFDSRNFQIIGMVSRFDQLEQPEKQYSACQIGPLMGVLGADGRLWHCCVQRGQPGFDRGSVLAVPFADAWQAAQTANRAHGIDVTQCPRCRYDNYNELLEGVQADALHVSFV